MKYPALVLVFTSSCAAPLCVTKAGLQFHGARDGSEVPLAWTCSTIQAVETVMVSRLPQFKASKLSFYQLTVVDPSTETDRWGRKVRGYTDCTTGEMVIWAYPAHPAFSALGHELAHALQGCAPNLPIDPGHDADHADWRREGIDAAEAATREGLSP